MNADEEMGPDRGFEFPTDDEDNVGHHHGLGGSGHTESSSSDASSSPRRSSLYGDHIGGVPSSYQTTWPQSYRQSIDVFSNVPSPNVGFLAASNLVSASSSFLRRSPSVLSTAHEQAHGLTKPLVTYPSFTGPASADVSHSLLPHPDATSKSFAFASYCDLPPPHQCSTAQAVLNVKGEAPKKFIIFRFDSRRCQTKIIEIGVNVLAGVGILSTPYAIKEGGWFGMLLLFGLGIISCYTGVLLKKCLDSLPGLKTYPDIGHAAFGVSGRLFISIVLYLELYGCCVEYITLVGDNLASIFPDAGLSFLGVELTPHQIFAITTALMVLPTVWLKNLSLLSYLSAGGVLATLLVVLCLLWVGVVDQVGFHPGGSSLNLVDLPVALGLYGFCYSGHSVFPNIYSSMKIPSQFPYVLVICFMLCITLYAGVAATGYLMFGDSIESQFTLNMPKQYMSSRVAVWTTVVNPLSKYALTMTPVALSIEELLPSTNQSSLLMVFIRALLVLSTLVVALSVPFFASVMALLGSVFTMLVALILPCACYLSIKRRSVGFFQVSMCILIIMVGVACSIIGSYSSIKQMVEAH